MKKTLSYPELWKQKQRELPVKGNPDAEWAKMRAVLDERMPVSGVIKKPARFKLPKWGLKVLLGVSTAAAVYVGARLYLSKTHHDLAKPGMQQIHRDSLAPAASGASPARDSVKPAIATGIPVITPVTPGADPRLIHQSKLNTDTPKRGQQIIDSIKAPAVLNVPVHRDSLLMPVESVPLKPVRDSISPVDLRKNDLQKDTSNTGSKGPKKKKRRKISIFY